MIPGIVAGGVFAVERRQYRVPVTVPAASIGATLTNFPVYVDLSTMPSDFWDHLYRQDGGDIRVKDSGGTDIPFDLIWIDYAGRKGALFYKQTLTAGGDTVAYIHYGSSEDVLVPPTAPNGRNAVWSDYHRVFTFGSDPFTDRTGSGNNLTPTAVNQAPFQFSNTSTSPNLGVHQGVAWDGTYYYVTDNNLIRKYDASFNLVASNTNPCGDVQAATGDAVNHCGDPCVVDGVLYVPVERYISISTWSLMKIARFRASDLAFLGADSIAAQNHEASSVCYRADDDMLYVSSYADGSKLWKYARSDLSYQGTLSLSSTIPQIQGVTYWRGAFWINSDASGWDSTIRVTSDGTVQGRVWGITGGNYEGIDFNDTGLLVLHDTTGSADGVIREIQPLDIALGGGVDFPRVSTAYLTAAVNRYTTWTIGASVQLDTRPGNMAIASYTLSGSTTSETIRATLAYRHQTTQMGLWNQTDGWLNDTLTPPSTGVTYRMHVTHTDTDNRKIYRDGANMQIDSGVAAKPGSTANALLLGVEDASLSELLDGKLGFVYLRASELSADWIAAEYSNLSAPGSFYIVGSEEEL